MHSFRILKYVDSTVYTYICIIYVYIYLFVGSDFGRNDVIFCSTTRKPLTDDVSTGFFHVDLNVGKPGACDNVSNESIEFGRPGNSASQGLGSLETIGNDFVGTYDHVGYGNASTWLQHTENITEYLWLVGG